MFKRNSLWLGIIVGTILPLAVYGLLYALLAIYNNLAGAHPGLNENQLQLISPVVNLFIIRYYFVSLKYDDTGRGVLLVTFIYVIAYFVLNQ
ncbi:MAG: hypothetical protein RQ761_10720 [Bacteroidales bacterium]|nr:hypothetical protein [Bacteroidales bacterium]